jgi:hypothetical protein
METPPSVNHNNYRMLETKKKLKSDLIQLCGEKIVAVSIVRMASFILTLFPEGF